jgi:hypothetical protein
MQDWAIVIGINKYWSPGAHLRRAVSDALSFTQWLLDENGGNIQPENLFLLTSDTKPGPVTFPDGITPLPEGVNMFDATAGKLNSAILKLLKKSGEKGNRFFFYFAGHGTTERLLGLSELMFMTDFDGDNPQNAITLESVTKYFLTTGFKEQIFFFDACRSPLPSQYISERQIRPGSFPFFPRYNDPIPAPLQYVLYATAPGSKAADTFIPSVPAGPGVPNEQNSVFTHFLLKGLKGEGSAKVYRPESRNYEVTVERLFDYVTRCVEIELVNVAEFGTPSEFQKPKRKIDNLGIEDPVLAELSIEDVDDVPLSIIVTPESVREHAAVLLRSADSSYDESITPVRESPISLRPRVLPMQYVIKGFAPGFQPVITSPGFKVLDEYYDTATISINFTKDETIGGLPPWEIERDDLPPGTLTILSLDPLAPIEIRDSQNKLVAFGHGQLALADVEKGFYRARLSLPDENPTGKLVELNENDQNISLDGALPLDSDFFNSVVGGSNLTLSTRSKILMLPTSGAIAAGGSSTILMLVSLSLDGTKWNDALEHFNPPVLHDDPEEFISERISVVIADETVPSDQVAEHLSSLDLRLRDQNGEGEAVILEGGQWSEGIGQFTAAAKDGNYILSINLADRNIANFSVSLLSGRTSLLILHRLIDGDLRIYGFSPAVESSGADASDPSFLQLRRMELLQRFHISNRIDATHALIYADEIQKAEVFDPLAAGLSCFTKVSLDRAVEMADLPQRLMWEFEELPDGYVLYAEQLAARGEPDEVVRDKYLDALNHGIPVFARGARRLAGAAGKYGFTHPRLEYLRRIVDNLPQNSVWTYWSDNPDGEGS